jgi:hypothetical protein
MSTAGTRPGSAQDAGSSKLHRTNRTPAADIRNAHEYHDREGRPRVHPQGLTSTMQGA